ncbi:PSME3-interacting protein [Episyrphus balteatus]|uniref:PSME3-interacting protein n=1 Tax=Episyrphus balteatus TaxID=286459 RepID=UPI002485477C|nr:PSME3-interacting protein [Episyrphus balteatus]
MSSGFVTETEAVEARKRRQEEWEKVRTPDQPLERPEEPYDGRTLYDKLKDQKLQKDMEYEEAHKLKNLIRGLDDDEVEFLDLVDRTKMNAEKLQMQEEAKELREFRERVATVQEESIDKKIQSEIAKPKAKTSHASNSSSRQSQKSLIGAVVKRKNGEVNAVSPKVAKTETVSKSPVKAEDAEPSNVDPESNKLPTSITTSQLNRGSLKCTAILPGIGPYNDTSDSEMSSDSDDEPQTGCQYDLVGRKRPKKKVEHE